MFASTERAKIMRKLESLGWTPPIGGSKPKPDDDEPPAPSPFPNLLDRARRLLHR